MGLRVGDDAPVVVAGSLVFDGEIVEVEVVVVCEFDSIFAVVELGGGLVFLEKFWIGRNVRQLQCY